MKKKMKKIKFPRNAICWTKTYPTKAAALAAVKLLKAAGIKASIDAKDFGRKELAGVRFGGRGTRILVWTRQVHKSNVLLELSARLERLKKKGGIMLPPEENTLENLDMLIHDCRQYLFIAEGKIKSIEEEGELELDDPTNDIEKITIRLKRLKDQCMRAAGGQPLDWQHGGGLNLDAEEE
jgi:hypothetical protein